ncbi:MAG: YbaB/EbfC family nucleoid-associated protein [Pseudomonadota bacterium]
MTDPQFADSSIDHYVEAVRKRLSTRYVQGQACDGYIRTRMNGLGHLIEITINREAMAGWPASRIDKGIVDAVNEAAYKAEEMRALENTKAVEEYAAGD